MKKWKCTVCGYIHNGAEPPETCPVCGADKSKFIEITEEAPSPEAKAEAPEMEKAAPEVHSRGLYGLMTDLMVKQHAHPISVHIPNGLLPVSIIFIFISLILSWPTLGQAAFYNLVMVVLAMPFVIFSGYVDWQRRYGGNLTTYFMIKMICAAVVTLTAAIVVVWAWIDPGILVAASGYRFVFLLICVVMVAAAGIAGFIGGKLVFNDK